MLFWRTADLVVDPLTAPPEPVVIQFAGYLPEPCLLSPEQVTEYPHSMELPPELRREVENQRVWLADEEPEEDPYEEAPTPQDVYDESLSVSPGWKVGGWPRWGLTDPAPIVCAACGSEMNPLLTMAHAEWGPTTETWIPYEDQAVPASVLNPYPAEPTRIQVADIYGLQLYICSASPEHPQFDLVQ
ncbi:non-ribosomal peptide synthetase (plasmid) [Streptomyces sp. BI20]|uniref:non-ribosomal peptide synthetase n=1 Tax=Streptomyces sp. BI20 TaxID=3403460 RepID=UPI003C794D15